MGGERRRATSAQWRRPREECIGYTCRAAYRTRRQTCSLGRIGVKVSSRVTPVTGSQRLRVHPHRPTLRQAVAVLGMARSSMKE